ncbi:MAG: DUF4097 family beta strand repeat-containing protein [Spirochaetota bacterium]
MKQLAALTAVLMIATAAFATGQRESGDFAYGDIESLLVEGETFNVEVIATSADRVSMEVENYPDDWTVYHSASGTAVRVWVERDFSLFSAPHRGRLVFRVPASTELTVDNSTGDVAVTGLSGGVLELETSTGSIALDGLSGDVRANSTTGSIDIRTCDGTLLAESTTGSIRVVGFTGEVDSQSTTGEQRLEEIDGDIRARSTTGTIQLRDTEGRLSIDTSTGVQLGREVTLTGDSSFSASTGSIEIDLTNELDRLEFDLTSTTGSLQVGNDRSQRRLFLGGTGITVTASTSTGSQRFF